MTTTTPPVVCHVERIVFTFTNGVKFKGISTHPRPSAEHIQHTIQHTILAYLGDMHSFT